MPQHTTLKHKSKVCFLAETTQPDEIKIQHQEKGYLCAKKGSRNHTPMTEANLLRTKKQDKGTRIELRIIFWVHTSTLLVMSTYLHIYIVLM